MRHSSCSLGLDIRLLVLGIFYWNLLTSGSINVPLFLFSVPVLNVYNAEADIICTELETTSNNAHSL